MPSPIGPDFHYHTKIAREASISPDGASVVYTVGRFERDSPLELKDVYVQRFEGGEPSLLLENASLAAWSPGGSHLAFLRSDANGVGQLWKCNADGSNAVQITQQVGAVDAFAWSPSGDRIAFRADVNPDAGRDELVPRSTERIRFHQDGFGWRGDAFRQIFVLDVSSGESRQLTDAEAEHGPPVWSPSGDRIAYLTDQGPFRDTTSRNEVYVQPASGGKAERWSGGLFMSDAIAWSPDGKKLAVIGAERVEQVGGHGLTCQGWIYVLEPGAYPRRLTDDSLRPISGANIPLGAGTPAVRWPTHGQIFFIADARGESFICIVDPESKQVRRVTKGAEQIIDWDVSASHDTAVTASNTLEGTGELYAIDTLHGERVQLTQLNDVYFAEHPVATLERVTVTSEKREIDVRVWFPPDFDPNRSYPVLLDVHGGPHSVFYDAFYPVHQVGATNGYIVVAPNPRGSSSYGLEFATAVHGDWGGGDYVDLMAALSSVLKRPYADENRVVMHGSSYGGFMASWAVGHTDRFKAAVIGAPVTNLPSFYGTSDIGVPFSEVQFGGSRSKNLPWYVRHSPMTYADNVSTPVLLIHGEEDGRVLIEQSEQYFVALKRAGKTVEFVRMPKTSHGIFRAKHGRIREEYFGRMLNWFSRFLNQPPDFTGNGSNGR
jgi:dipeptidyl aminopeptidase/acylaminoacyl peptidase